jgi:uncharacterized damage-inducible protein DinB
MEDTNVIKDRLAKHLMGGEAFMKIEEMLKLIEFNKLGIRPDDLPYSFFEIFSHIRFTQKDILDYCTLLDYKAPNWPKDYWPEHRAPKSSSEWEELKNSYLEERKSFVQYIKEESNDLLKTLNKDTDHTLFREVLLVIEHTAYHSGQLLIILQKLGLYNA